MDCSNLPDRAAMARRPVTPVTLRDIARRTGFHESTVSRALNARTRHLVAADAAARILAAARELDYRPNYMAAALRTQRSMTVGLIVDDLADPATAAGVAAIEAALRAAGYTLAVAATGGDPARLAAALATLDGHGADGAILLDRQAPPAAGAARRIALVDAGDLRSAAAGIGTMPPPGVPFPAPATASRDAAATGRRAVQRLLLRLAGDAPGAPEQLPAP